MLHRQARPVSGLHSCLHFGDGATARRSRHATLLCSQPAFRPSDDVDARTTETDQTRARRRAKHPTARQTRKLAQTPTHHFLCAEVLVAIGVVGESVAGFLHWRRSGQLQAIQTAENLSLQGAFASLQKESDGFRAQIATSNATAAAANARAAEADLARAQLEARLAPRTLIGPKATEFIRALAPIVPGVAIDIVSFEGMGSDVAPLSADLATALNAAGAAAVVLTPMGGGGAVIRGILVRTAADASASDKAIILPIVAALIKAGFAAAQWQEYPANEPPSGGYMGPTGRPLAKVRILVGAKV
jgi:hypothetical protein